MTKKAPEKTAPEERIWDKFLTERDKAVFQAAGYGALEGHSRHLHHRHAAPRRVERRLVGLEELTQR